METNTNNLKNNVSTIELTNIAIEKFNLAKNNMEDGTKLSLRITACSHG
ncbi:MAG: hypothetical protein ACRDA4_05790 [Filifactoraceae bacterium]